MLRRLPIIFLLVFVAACHEDPGHPDVQPLYRGVEPFEPSSGERGNMLINEIHFAGSVTDEGVWDRNDVFIELWNKHPRPINVSGWRLIIRGDYNREHIIPPVRDAVPPNGYFVIAARADGAFGDIADVIIEDLRLGDKHVYVQLRDADRRLMEGGGSRFHRVFAGGYDLVTARSMERAVVIFGNIGSVGRNWHAYSDDVGFPTIREGWRQRTLASPGVSNSRDYSGNTSSGNFE